MAEQLFAPLNWIIGIAEKLLTEETFNDKQRGFLLKIAKEAQALRTLALTILDISQPNAKENLSYDGRSHLSSIIAYTEELLDEIEGELSDNQRDLLFEARSSAKQLLSEIQNLSE
jgi:signal transduction histidine kinase